MAFFEDYRIERGSSRWSCFSHESPLESDPAARTVSLELNGNYGYHSQGSARVEEIEAAVEHVARKDGGWRGERGVTRT